MARTCYNTVHHSLEITLVDACSCRIIQKEESQGLRDISKKNKPQLS